MQTLVVFITTDARLISITVESAETVADLKQNIEAKNGMKVEYQQLSYLGKPLNHDDDRLYVYGVHMESTLLLIMRMPGGK